MKFKTKYQTIMNAKGCFALFNVLAVMGTYALTACVPAASNRTVASEGARNSINGDHLEVSLKSRALNADVAITGKVESATATMDEDSRTHDHLIRTHSKIRVSNALKGETPATIELITEGGTINAGTPNALTLMVSDMPKVIQGEQLLLILKKADDHYKLHKRELGVLAMDEKGTGLKSGAMTLEQIKAEFKK